MQITQEIQTWADLIATATGDLSRAQQALRDDKNRRQSSLRGRFVDWLTSTPAEKDVEDKTERLAAISANASKAAQQWIVNEARAGLQSSAEDMRRHTEQGQRIENARKRQERAGRLLDLAQTADEKLAEARSDCESASTTELLDLVSTNKALSVLSTFETSDAADSVKEAAAALKALSEALPKRSAAAEFDMPDDFLDLVVDLAIAPVFDILSFFNMQRLDKAASQCREASEKLAPLLARLQKLHHETLLRVSAEEAALRVIEAPYLQAAAALVPPTIRVQVPTILYAKGSAA
ncbi:hypothetical protein WDX82_005127 [Salmonella enterica]